MTTLPKKMLVPLALPGLKTATDKTFQVLAGDVGGTKTNLALYEAVDEKINLLAAKSYHSGKYSSLDEVILQFCKDHPFAKQEKICAGVAGPVIKGKVHVTNLPWEIDIQSLRKTTGIHSVSLINDLEATAYGLAGLTKEDMFTIREGDPGNDANIAVLAPGTGLGEAGLYWDGQEYHPFATEGGHCDFASRTELDMELHQFLQKKVGVVSWEHVVSGMGIYNIYEFLRDGKKRAEPAALKAKLKEADDPTALISESAAQKEFEICRETMRLFVRYLAHESCNLVLKMKASGGLFLGGGIPPKVTDLLLEERFYMHYKNCDRMQELVESVPISVIMNDKTALIGAAYYGAYGPEMD
jgi:glucokinase